MIKNILNNINLKFIGTICIGLFFFILSINSINSFPEGKQEQRKHSFEINFLDQPISSTGDSDQTSIPWYVDSVTDNADEFNITGWTAASTSAKFLIFSEYSSLQLNRTSLVHSIARPDVAKVLNDMNEIQSGFKITLQNSEFGKVNCVYRSVFQEITLLYQNPEYSCP